MENNEMISKAEVRKIVTDLIEASLRTIKVVAPTEKTKKSLVKLSRKFASILHDEIKKQEKMRKKALRAVKEKEVSKVEKKKAKISKTKVAKKGIEI
jgi:hypothetical protein